MSKKVDFSKYNGYFHDGYLRKILHKGRDIEFCIESCIINPQEISEKQILSDDHKIKGVLKVKSVNHLILNDRELQKPFKMEYDYAEILTLKTSPREVYLLIEWDNYPPKPHAEVLNEIKVTGEEVHWTNILS